ncbi:MAG: ZIP family metal transporter [Bacilli bacterium]|nr:ZIP family metal transporter [Bacilli bacterium]
MEYIGWVILVTAVSGIIGTGLGGLIGVLVNKNSNKGVSLLLSFAGGIMLAIVVFDLFQESIIPFIKDKQNNWYYVVVVLGCAFVGYILVYLINNLIDKRLSKEVPHTSSGHPDLHDDLNEMIHLDHIEVHKKNHNSLFVAGLITAIVIALHNLPEGIAIGASYATNPSAIIVSSGFALAVVIGLHNVPEGMAVAVPLVVGGTKKWKAVLITASTGIPTVIGAVIGFAIGNIGPIGLSISLALASGAMLYVVFGELLPESYLMWKSKLPALVTFVGLLIGFLIVLI